MAAGQRAINRGPGEAAVRAQRFAVGWWAGVKLIWKKEEGKVYSQTFVGNWNGADLVFGQNLYQDLQFRLFSFLII